MKFDKQKIAIYTSIALLVMAGYFLYQYYNQKALDEFNSDTEISDIENNMPFQCGNGEWTEFPNYSTAGKFPEYKGNVTLKMDKDENFTNEDASVTFTTDENYSLTFFVDKATRIEGIDIGKDGKREIYVKRLKCIGKEADANIQKQRQNIMNYINDNIDTLALEKSPNANSKWQVETFYFVNDNDFYVEYETPESVSDDGVYDARLWLVRVPVLEQTRPVLKTLAYIQEDANDPEKNILKQGQDIYADVTGMTVYEYDDDAKQWIFQ